MVLSWNIRRFLWLLAAACIGIAASAMNGCSGEERRANPGPESQQAPVGATEPQGLSLPKPSELKQVSHTESDLFSFGKDFVAAFPHQRVSVVEDRALFSPAWETETAAFEELAFSIYSFDLEDYDRAEIINVWWEEGGSDLTAWYGFANFAGDHWDWAQRSLDPTGHDKPGDGIRFDSELHIDPVTSRMFFVPVLMEPGVREISEINVGGLRPITAHGIFPNAGVPDQIVTFSAFVAGSEPIS